MARSPVSAPAIRSTSGDVEAGANATLAYTPDAAGTGGILSVSDGADTASIALLGQYAAPAFVASAASGGGTAITYAPQLSSITGCDGLANPQPMRLSSQIGDLVRSQPQRAQESASARGGCSDIL